MKGIADLGLRMKDTKSIHMRAHANKAERKKGGEKKEKKKKSLQFSSQGEKPLRGLTKKCRKFAHILSSPHQKAFIFNLLCVLIYHENRRVHWIHLV